LAVFGTQCPASKRFIISRQTVSLLTVLYIATFQGSRNLGQTAMTDFRISLLCLKTCRSKNKIVF